MSDQTPLAYGRKLERQGWVRQRCPGHKEKHQKWKHPLLEDMLVFSIGRKDLSPAVANKIGKLMAKVDRLSKQLAIR